ncbi:MAG: 5'/3'-nucleotidase SurE [Brevinema sp.]
MKILFSNDDGYEAVGIQTIYKEFFPHFDAYMCAPLKHKSAFSHAINYYDYLKLVPLTDGIKGFALDGTPADTVRASFLGLFDEEFDLVLSGINYGVNAGQDVFYSGTVGAAREATFFNKLGIASSLDLEGSNKTHLLNLDIEKSFQYAAKMMRKFVSALTPEILAYQGSVININFPASYPATGIKVVKPGHFDYVTELDYKKVGDEVSVKIDTVGKSVAKDQEHTDAEYLSKNYIVITALSRGVVWDETLHNMITFLEDISIDVEI